MNTAVICWTRFGPYHIARINALSVALGSSWRLLAVEVSSLDQYEWNSEHEREEAGAWERKTLFPGQRYESLPAAKVRQAMRELLDSIRPDLLLINGWGTTEARSQLRWLKRHPDRRGFVMSETLAGPGSRVFWKEWLKRKLLAAVHGALVGGRSHADYLLRLGFAQKPMAKGYDAVDNRHFSDGASAARKDAAQLRRELCLPERYYMVCSRFLPRKNLDGLIRAWARYQRECGPDAWSLVITGSGEARDELWELARGLGLLQLQRATAVPASAHLRWAGFIQYDALPVWYGLASAFVHPAKTEAWGLVANEAAACTLPLLLSRTMGAAEELLVEGVTGWSFDPYDDSELCRLLARMASLPESERVAMGAAAAKQVSHYGPARFGEGVVELLERSRLQMAAA